MPLTLPRPLYPSRHEHPFIIQLQVPHHSESALGARDQHTPASDEDEQRVPDAEALALCPEQRAAPEGEKDVAVPPRP
jgi:hypothetical protein